MEKRQRVVIFAAGQLYAEYLKTLKKNDIVIGVDRATLWLIKHGLMPNYGIGDFDSVTSTELKEIKLKVKNLLEYPREKDATDLELALDFVLKINPQDVLIYGAIGDRLDQSIGSVFLLEKLLKHGIKAEIADRNNSLRLIKERTSIKRKYKFKYLSVLPFSSTAVVSVSGCRYNLLRKKLNRRASLGISNEIVGKTAEVAVHQGLVLLIQSRDLS
ncbi:thiamine diphosphokinase [Candidatus Gottesmanbacteria bacterium RIFCSPLOWO2_02_FULL_42_29]|uniref:Thiamine diphosphokinase n=2 Tax=Candidatus Gottesmaniibacteriota TaxID=1752720 RepID=A0A1F6B7Q7_9BACT|nr:MAG: Thiamine pyrophosphokinase [Candidatus Gottesmanbacteria bacterium GW2011_GWA2_42_18]OGG10835.1 MAG: thiamine diphosphokinase [Candidatus Gottesmanbacteria bacterium RIFCSPHIGHO2_01_FULL_42_27]OGG19505.1 MAG: thiamine diphosphokinase [Candidatus Gottesmanbacteria bacterium RIFCSPHIGHO2_12_FULL_43_26]OGG32928.1 MAG: thiamine diphosphokinase [Candidatus Gottesmanbacteria bacterium RIFCSPLOWO2_01_FULL_42_22]OGG36041.1 MAG: thiamine diphosphokinase [Candidatus Gottesmanbacteria bacterium RI